MMKNRILCPALALGGGAVCFAMRLWQCLTGFEPDTGLAASGSLAGSLLPLTLLGLAAAFFLAVRPLPKEPSGALFSTGLSPSGLWMTVLVSALLLLAAAGGLRLLQALFPLQLPSMSNRGVSLAEGIFYLLCSLSLFPAARAAKAGGRLNANLLLVPAVCLVADLVLVYRASSVNPVLQSYYVEILALAFLILAFYRLSSFGFRCGQLRLFSLYAMLAAVLCLTAAADSLYLLVSGISSVDGLSGLAFWLGGGGTALGFLAVRQSVDPGMIFPART